MKKKKQSITSIEGNFIFIIQQSILMPITYVETYR